MNPRVIINADDFGLTSKINRAVIEAHQKGIVSSTTIIGNCDDKLLLEAKDLAIQNKDLGVGIKLVLSKRAPLLKTHKTLVNDQGFFKYYDGKIGDDVDLNEVYQEWKAQIKRMQEHFDLTHIDSYHLVHLDDKLYNITRKLCREFRLPMRSVRDNFPMEVKTDLSFYKEGVTLENLKDILLKHRGTFEISTHPNFAQDDFLEEISNYTKERETTLSILQDASLKPFLDENDIKLVNYNIIKLK